MLSLIFRARPGSRAGGGSLSYLVETNVVSELRKGDRCHPVVAIWIARVPSEEIYLSVLTVGELRKGTASSPPLPRFTV
jgi:predicted nucleic acid-binding protein